MNDVPSAKGKGPFSPLQYGLIGAAAAGLLLLVLMQMSSCRRNPAGPGYGARVAGAPLGAALENEMLESAIRDLDRMDTFITEEEHRHLVDRLNLWVKSQPPPADWRVDPMAEPIVKATAGFAAQLKPIRDALRKPMDLLDLKSLALRFEEAPNALAELAQRRSLSDLAELERRYEAFLRGVAEAVRQFPDPAALEEAEKELLEAFVRQVRDRATLERFKGVLDLARQLDSPQTLREAARLQAFAQRLDGLGAQWDRKALKDLAARLGELARRKLGGAARMKTALQVEFVVEQMEMTAAMRDLAKLKVLAKDLDPAGERIKNAGRRVGRADVVDLAPEVEAARKRLDPNALKAVADRLLQLAKPRDIEDIKTCAADLTEPAKALGALSARIGEFATRADLGDLKNLARYVGNLASQARSIGEMMIRPVAQPSDPKTLDRVFGEFAGQFMGLGSQVEQLAAVLDHLASLEAPTFDIADRVAFQEAVILRDLARWARGDEHGDLSRAKRLFDWTVRNVQLEPGVPQHMAQLPGETLLFGRGTAIERAWVFILLLRQQGLDAAILAIDDPSDPLGVRVRPWVVGVLSEGNLYLFDPALGLPVPGPGGVKLDAAGRLDVHPATLAQVVADDALLRRLDLDKDEAYPVKASQLGKVVALVEGAPAYLTQRMRTLESRLAGQARMVLTASPSAQAERLRAIKHLADVRLWALPFETVFQRVWRGSDGAEWQMRMMLPFEVGRPPALRFGRVAHLRGNFNAVDTKPGATDYYMMARPSRRDLNAIKEMDPNGQMMAVFELAKHNASYWLGLIAFEQDNFPSAEDYFKTRTLADSPQGQWTPGATYNLGRVYEAQGDYARAIRQYRASRSWPEHVGSELRGRWLQSLTGAKPAAAEQPTKAPSEGPKIDMPTLPGLPELPGLPDEPEKKPSGKPEPGKTAPSKADPASTPPGAPPTKPS